MLFLHNLHNYIDRQNKKRPTIPYKSKPVL